MGVRFDMTVFDAMLAKLEAPAKKKGKAAVTF
jgi:hypothetical protein